MWPSWIKTRPSNSAAASAATSTALAAAASPRLSFSSPSLKDIQSLLLQDSTHPPQAAPSSPSPRVFHRIRLARSEVRREGPPSNSGADSGAELEQRSSGRGRLEAAAWRPRAGGERGWSRRLGPGATRSGGAWGALPDSMAWARSEWIWSGRGRWRRSGEAAAGSGRGTRSRGGAWDPGNAGSGADEVDAAAPRNHN